MPDQQRTIEIDGQMIEYVIRKSKRARNVSIHVDHYGGVEVVVPRRLSYRLGDRFLSQRKPWLLQHVIVGRQLAQQRPVRRFETGEMISLLGQSYQLIVSSNQNRIRGFVECSENMISVKVGTKQDVRALLERWYRRQARNYFQKRTLEYATRAGAVISGISIGNQRSQWGSCSRSGRLSFNWRLVLGPIDVCEYVAAHEVAHLRFHNHTLAFWSFLSELYPSHLEAEQWLKKYHYKLSW